MRAERLVEVMGWYRIMFLEGALQDAMLDVTAAIDAVVDAPHLPAVLRAALALGNALGYGAGTRATSFCLNSLRVLRCDRSPLLPCGVSSLSLSLVLSCCGPRMRPSAKRGRTMAPPL